MRAFMCTLTIVSALGMAGCGQANISTPSPAPAAQVAPPSPPSPPQQVAPANDVEAVLKRSKWQQRSGLSNGVAWQFTDGGKVLIHDGGNIDESYRWEVVSRNEGDRKITVKFWRPSEGEHQHWTFFLVGDGQPVKVERFVYRGSATVRSNETTLYPMN